MSLEEDSLWRPLLVLDWSESGSSLPKWSPTQLRYITQWHCWLHVAQLVQFVSTVAAVCTKVGSAWLFTIVALFARTFKACRSPCLLLEVGLCCHSCILDGTVCRAGGSEYSKLSLVGHCVHCPRLDHEAIGKKGTSWRIFSLGPLWPSTLWKSYPQTYQFALQTQFPGSDRDWCVPLLRMPQGWFWLAH